MKFMKVGAAVLGIEVVLATVPAYKIFSELRKAASEDPRVYADDVAALVLGTKERGELVAPVLFIGSSSIRFWETLDRDMQPLVTIRHGFGGSKLADVEFYAEELVTAFAPRAVVVFAGTNDISPGNTKPPEVLFATYQRFVAKVRATLPSVQIFYIGITPSILRWEVWDEAQATNQLIAEFCELQAGLYYIETGPNLLGADGKPNSDNYRFDGLHLSARGYAIWTDVIQSRLLKDLDDHSNH